MMAAEILRLTATQEKLAAEPSPAEAAAPEGPSVEELKAVAALAETQPVRGFALPRTAEEIQAEVARVIDRGAEDLGVRLDGGRAEVRRPARCRPSHAAGARRCPRRSLA